MFSGLVMLIFGLICILGAQLALKRKDKVYGLFLFVLGAAFLGQAIRSGIFAAIWNFIINIVSAIWNIFIFLVAGKITTHMYILWIVLFLGAFAGIAISTLCITAKRADNWSAKTLDGVTLSQKMKRRNK